MPFPTLSLVIPAYNEEGTIGALLESIRDQREQFVEILVVNNSSTDGTARVLAELAPGFPNLQVIDEPSPGVICARNAGFDRATGDLIGRLDADARAKPGWALAVRTFFATADESIGAGSGRFDQYDMPLQWLHKAILNSGLRGAGDGPREIPALFGANMVIRRSLWKDIRPALLETTGILDDLDITLCVTDAGHTNVLIEGMEISASGRRMLSSVRNYRTFTEYLPATFDARGRHQEAAQARRGITLMRALHLALYVPVRAWDPTARRYSLRRLFGHHTERVLPYSRTT